MSEAVRAIQFLRQIQGVMEHSMRVDRADAFEGNEGVIKLAGFEHSSCSANHVDMNHLRARDASNEENFKGPPIIA